MEPLLSVVVPAYGVADYLPDCLDSILASTLKEIEVIVVDDESPDEVGEIADDYARRDPRVRVLHIANSGVGPARNEGVKMARGRYLVFVDSDDLVPPRAFELMVTTLEQTGSDFVAGNAWRYFPGRLVPSWTHRQAFAEDILRTNIREFPLLVRDRMPWNKVWRKSFWDEHRFEFPAMRYEDYPVVMRAHVLAKSVDVLSARIYLWRQRGLQTSITQRSADPDNVRDRVVSAEMVLDIAEGSGDEQIAEDVHAYLIDVDLVTIAEAIAGAAPEDREELEGLFLRLAKRLKPQRHGRTTRLARLLHKAGRRGDFEMVRAMGAWRQGGNRKKLLSAMAKPARAISMPSMLLAVTPKRSKALAIRNRRLRNETLSTDFEEGHFVVKVRVKLRSSLLRRAVIRGELVTGKRVYRLPATVTIDDEPGGVVTVRVPAEEAGQWLVDGAGHLRLFVQVGLLSWRGPVPIRVDLMPVPVPLEDGAWLVASRNSRAVPHLWFRRRENAVVGEVRFDADGVTVAAGEVAEGFIGVVRTAPSPMLLAPLVDGEARFAWDDLAEGDPADNPASGTSYRRLVYLKAPTREEALRLAEEDDGPCHVFSLADAEPVDHGEHQFRLGRTVVGSAELVMQQRDYVEE